MITRKEFSKLGPGTIIYQVSIYPHNLVSLIELDLEKSPIAKIEKYLFAKYYESKNKMCTVYKVTNVNSYTEWPITSRPLMRTKKDKRSIETEPFENFFLSKNEAIIYAEQNAISIKYELIKNFNKRLDLIKDYEEVIDDE